MTNPGTADLVAWWSLDESSGNRADSHDNNLTLTDNNTVGSATGKQSNGADFEVGTTEYLSRASESLLQTGDIDYSFALWFKPESSTAEQRLVAKGANTGNNREYLLSLQSDNALNFQVYDSGTAQRAEGVHSGTISDAAWGFIVVYHDATANEIGISLNGGAYETTATSGVLSADSNAFNIGGENGGATADGVIDEVAFWKNKVLSAAEVTWLYNSGNGRSYNDVAVTAFSGTLATTGAMTASASLNAYPLYSARAARRAFHTTALQDADARDIYVVERETTMLPGESYDMDLEWVGASAISGEASKVWYGNQDVSAAVLSGSNSSGTNPQTSKVVTIPAAGYWGRTLILEWSATVDGAAQKRWLKIYVPRPTDFRDHHRLVDERETVMIPGESTNLVLLMNGVANIDTPTSVLWHGTQDLSATFLTGAADASQNVITSKTITIPATGYAGKTLVHEWGGSADSTTQKRWLRIRVARVPR